MRGFVIALPLLMVGCTQLLVDDAGVDASLVDAGCVCLVNETCNGDGTCERAEIVDLSASNSHACVVLDNGEIICWGQNEDNQLGREAPTLAELPGRVIGINDARSVSTGPGGTCAIREGGRLDCWGDNMGSRFGPIRSRDRREVADSGVDQVSVGTNHICWIESGAVFCVGKGGSGQLGNGAEDSMVAIAADLPSSETFVGVVAGPQTTGYTCAWNDAGAVYCFGNGAAPIGRMSTETVNPPTLVSPLGHVVGMAAMPFTACALQMDLRVSCWGNNLEGEFGFPSPSRAFPTPMELTGLVNLSDIAATASHVLGIEAGSAGLRVHGWGRNESGQLGSDTLPADVPPDIVFSGPDSVTKAWIGAGAAFSCIAYELESGRTEVRCAGSNDHLQLGVEGPSRSTFDADPFAPPDS